MTNQDIYDKAMKDCKGLVLDGIFYRAIYKEPNQPPTPCEDCALYARVMEQDDIDPSMYYTCFWMCEHAQFRCSHFECVGEINLTKNK